MLKYGVISDQTEYHRLTPIFENPWKYDKIRMMIIAQKRPRITPEVKNKAQSGRILKIETIRTPKSTLAML